MTESPFLYRHRVVYADCTLGNHVYYARFLEVLEAARGAFFRMLGTTLLDWQTRGWMFPVIEAQLRYRTLARYDDLLLVEVRVTRAERVRLNFAYRIVNQSNDIVLEGETLHVCMTVDEKMKRLPEELVIMLKPHLDPGQL